VLCLSFEKLRARRFVFQLEHYYTPSTVGPDFLKGTDAALCYLLTELFNVSFEMLNEGISYDDPASYSLIDNEKAMEVLRIGTANVTDEEKKATLKEFWDDEFLKQPGNT